MIIYGLLFSLIGYAFTQIVMTDLLLGYRQWLIKTNKLPEWIKNPLGLCSVCFTGQISLWGMLPLLEWNYAQIIAYIGLISANMIIVLILQKLLENGSETD
jgi:hypothetical protein